LHLPDRRHDEATLPSTARCTIIWNWDGTLERIHHTLYIVVREQAGREASPTVAIIDTQTAKGAQKGLGSILQATTRARRSMVASGTSWSIRWVSCLTSLFIPADVQDRDGAFHLYAGRADCSRSSSAFSPMADMPETRWRASCGAPGMEVGNRKAIPCCRIRSLAQAMDRRKDIRLDQSQSPLGARLERYATTVAAFIRLAMIRIMLRRLAANASS
jgi:hypothetical protein